MFSDLHIGDGSGQDDSAAWLPAAGSTGGLMALLRGIPGSDAAA